MAQVQLFEEIALERAEDLLDFLMPHRPGPLTRCADWGWIFRGQSDATWDLVPSAFRIGPDGNPAYTQFKAAQVTEPPYDSMEDQINHEERFALDFASRVDRAGFEVPGDRPELRTPELAVVRHDGTEFPPVSQRWIYALAQHYGVPTRLLDWCRRPLVAAYFAAAGAAKKLRSEATSTTRRLAVWALLRPFVDRVACNWNPGPAIVTVPTVSNSNLRAQGGLFTLVRYQAGSPTPHRPPHLDALFRGKTIGSGELAAEDFSPYPVMCKFTCPWTEAPVLLHYLSLHDVDFATVYPAIHSVKDAMAEEKLRSVRRP